MYISTSEMDISLVLLEAFQHFSSGQLSAFIQIIMVKNMANSVYFIWAMQLQHKGPFGRVIGGGDGPTACRWSMGA